MIALLGLSAESVAAQEGRISGTVSDPAGTPLPGVQVYIPGLQIGGLSRANGRYLILNVPAGTHTVRAERIGLGSSE